MNEQNQAPILDADAPSSPGSQPSGAPTSTPPPAPGDWREQRRADSGNEST